MQREQHIEDLRNKVARFHGKRKVLAMARLAETLAIQNYPEAVSIAVSAVEQARMLCRKAEERSGQIDAYKHVLAQALLAHAVCLEGNFEEELHPKLLSEATQILEALDDWNMLLLATERTVAYYRLFDNLPLAQDAVEHGLFICEQKKLNGRACALFAARASIRLFNKQYDRTDEDLRSALDLLPQCRTASEKSKAHQAIAAVYLAKHDLATAIVHFTESRHLALSLGDYRSLAIVLSHLAYCYLHSQQTEKQARALLDGYEYAKSCGLAWIEGKYCHELGVRMRYYGNFTQAIKYFLRAEEIFEKTTEKVGLIAIMVNTGQLYVEFQDEAEGFRALRRALNLILTLPLRSSNLMAVDILLDYEFWTEAELKKAQGYALRVKEQKGLKMQKGMHPVICCVLGKIFRKLGDTSAAETEFNESLAAARVKEMPRYHAVRAQLFLASLYCELGRLDQALELALNAREEFDEIKFSRNYFQIKQTLLEIYKKRGEFTVALEQLEELRLAERQQNLERNSNQIFTSVQEIELKRQRSELEELKENNVVLQREMEVLKTEVYARNLQLEYINNVVRKWRDATTQSQSGNHGAGVDPQTQALQALTQALNDTILLTAHQDLSGTEDFVRRLSGEYPALTSTECKVCALIKTGSSTKEIADFLQISARTVETNRFRIRRKLHLEAGANLNDFIRGL